MKNKWVDRKFDFEFNFSIYPEFIQRLRAMPDTLESLIASIPQDLHKIKINQEWSIQENVGHLITVDALFIGRLEDYESGAKSLRPADVSGSRTNKENYNSDIIQNLLKIFREKRMGYILRLENTDSNLFNKTAWHPRLNKSMRLCDMLYFQAEHDAHHLDKIKYLHQNLS
jgi:uncharacterized damage-inducible protein DinB